MSSRPEKINGDEPDGYVVRGPRVTDAIGKALRGVFRDDPRLPDEIVLALHRLDCVKH